MKIQAIALNTFREAVRNKILYSVVLFAVLVVAGAAIFGRVTIGDSVRVIKDFGLFSLSFFGAVITIVSGVTLLAKEIKQKTVYNIISKPLPRWQFVVGKYLGLFMTVGVLVSIMGLSLCLFVGLYEGKMDPLMFQGLFYVILEVAILSAVAMFFSAVVVTVTLTGLFTLGTWIAGRSISDIKYFLDQEGANPATSFLVTLADTFIPDLGLLNVANELVHGVSPGIAHTAQATAYSICYSAVALILACLIFQRRELV